MSSISPAQRRAVDKYEAAHYKQIKLRLKHEESELAHSFAKDNGFEHSFNAFVLDCIHRRMEKPINTDAPEPACYEPCNQGDTLDNNTNVVTINMNDRLRIYCQALATSKNMTVEKYVEYIIQTQCGAYIREQEAKKNSISGRRT